LFEQGGEDKQQRQSSELNITRIEGFCNLAFPENSGDTLLIPSLNASPPPTAQTLPSQSAYYLVWPDWREESPKLAAFRAWLLSEIKEL